MSITFHHVPMSTSSITQAVLAELDVSVETVELDIDSGDTQTKAFLQINPNGRVPVIVHDGVVISESVAITLYLGEMFGVERGLFPDLTTLRGEAMKWTVWANINLADAAGKLAAELPPESAGAVQQGSQDFVPLALRHPDNLDKTKSNMNKCFDILDNALSERAFLLGDYSIVDTHMFVLVAWSMSMELDLSSFSHIQAWFERCSERPVLSAMMSGE
jgi:glutathione S-transferase